MRKYLKGTVKVYFNDREEIPGIRNRGRVQDLRRVNPRSRFYFYFSRKIRELRESGHEGTARAYASSLRSMQRYLGKKDFPFIKLSSRIISDYQGKLLASGICDNTIGFYLHNIKALFRKGCREMGLELPCPFRDISIKTEKLSNAPLIRL